MTPTRRMLALIVLPVFLIALVSPMSAPAATSKAVYDWHVADQFLHDAVGSPLGAIAEAPSGDTITVEGSGTIDVAAKTATGGGTFVHKDPAGNVVDTGTFTADSLISFAFYGCGIPDLPGSENLCGGLAKLNVTGTPDSEPALHAPAILWIDCLIGDKIPPSGFEGIRLNVKDIINFNAPLSEHEGSGFTVFVQH